MSVHPRSTAPALLYYHFANLSLPWLAFNTGILYTLGNYHVHKYGCAHFLKILGLAAGVGTLATSLAVYRDREYSVQGGISLSAGLITYHAFKNPSWFKFMISPMNVLLLLIVYSAFYNDRSAFGGIAGGYLAFLAAL